MRTHSLHCLGPRGFHRIVYREWGDPASRHIVVCVHGLTRNGRDFDYLARALAERCRVICPDVVGRGDSDWLENKADYGFTLYQSDAAACIARVTASAAGLFARLKGLIGLGGEVRLDWVGTSMGGLIGMMLAAQSNSPLRRLVLNDVGPIVPWTALLRLKGYASKPNRFDSLDEAEAYVREVCATFGPLSDTAWRHLSKHSVRRDQDGGFRLAYDPGISSAAALRGEFSLQLWRETLFGMDLWSVWDKVRCPTLALRGSQSDLLLAETAEEMQRRGPRAKVAEFPGVGHAPALMSNDQIRAVSEFLFARN